ncbi:uncharacterized protein LAESUDRAFT_730896 [Laetiporus sulphureus 93-53]|uniref:Uncharacterized protein n=1 Tax=Laetiporus sulphureus 93-53 TaxID=1314785 RepID=A0A165BX98_9APHY|nr:uncharacterized protein LAESUDRAFT_730896 [Laetiporus sulphureus 93-53]KZT01819.1 hypothetical protein LAESUDRAFT_730896 [Laetiporus sulphureus 93-53]
MVVISIRLATELLLGRCAVPDTANADGILTQHERGTFDELQGLLARRAGIIVQDTTTSSLPEYLNLVSVIGYHMAYDAAVQMGVDACLVDL